MRTKALSPNNKIKRQQTTQSREMPPKQGHHKDEGNRTQDSRQSHSSQNQKSIYHEAFISLHETGTTKQRARTTRLYTTVEMPSDITYVDRTETSLRADIQSPQADDPQSALGSVKSQHPPKCGTQQCTLHTVSARSLGHYAWGCISDILSPEDA